MSDSEFIRPFPALTPAQCYHLEGYGYVVGRLLEALLRFKRVSLCWP